MTNTVSAICEFCNSAFDAPLKELKRGNGRFCSLSCVAKNRVKTKTIVPKVHNCACSTCNCTFYRSVGNQAKSKSGYLFCGRACKDIAQRLEGIRAIHPSHYHSTKRGYSESYRAVAFRHYPIKCNRCGFDQYPEVLDVHHKDRNRLNNTPSNLEILCPTCHTIDHFINKDGRYTLIKPKYTLVKPKVTTP